MSCELGEQVAFLFYIFIYNSACRTLRLHARCCATQRGSAAEIRALHKSKFFLDVVEEPVALLQTLHGDVFRLGNCLEVRLQVNAFPALLAQGQDILNRALLLLPARIREGFCDGPLRKVEHVGKTEGHEIAGKTSEVLDAFGKKRFHFAWDIDRVPYCFHKQFVS